MTKLSKEYESTIEYPVAYEKLPNDKLLQETPLDEIGIHVRASGFKIISGKLFPRSINIDASLLYLKSKTHYFLLLSQQKVAIQRQMDAGVSIDHFSNDSIHFNLGLLKRRKLPIKLNAEITYENGFDIEGEIKLVPDSIYVSGPESIMDTIRFIETQKIAKSNANKSFREELILKKFKESSNVRLDTTKVHIVGSIEKYTESTISLPFTIVNLPEGVKINTYPKQVDVTYKVSLSNFGKINPSSFVIECNYVMSVDNNLQYLIPKLTVKSKLVKNVKISPKRIDFIIQK